MVSDTTDIFLLMRVKLRFIGLSIGLVLGMCAWWVRREMTTLPADVLNLVTGAQAAVAAAGLVLAFAGGPLARWYIRAHEASEE